MLFKLTSLLLFPVLLVQAIYVRKNTPKLAEPTGQRTGTTGSGDELSVLIVGDSAAAGVGVECQSQALLGQTINVLSKTHKVHWCLSAKTGDDSSHLIQRMLATSQQAFDHVVVSVGVNDVTSKRSIKEWQRNIERIASLAKERFSAKTIYFSSLPPMEHFPALKKPLNWWLGQRAKHLNDAMASIIASHDGCEMVVAPFVISAEFIAKDGFHPGQSAYQVWAEQLSTMILENHTSAKA